MKTLISLLVVVVASQFSSVSADEGLVFVDQWRNRLTESSAEFVFKKDGTFYAYEIKNIEVLGETKLFRTYLKGNWRSNEDPTSLIVKAEGLTHLIASDTGSSSFKTANEYRFLIENKKFFIVNDGKPQRELLKSPNSSDSVERQVRESLK